MVAAAGGRSQEQRAPAHEVETVRYWGEDEFAASAGLWNELCARSSADPLFMGWEWHWLWWRHHKASLDGTLSLIACYSGPVLVGLAPLYLRRATLRTAVRVDQCEFLGSTFRDGRGVFSEYLDVIAEPGYADAVAAAVARQLRADGRWASLVCGVTPRDGIAAGMVRRHFSDRHLVREVDPMEAHRTALTADFSSYLGSLSGTVRRKVWNQRKKLGETKVILAVESDIAEVLDLLETWQVDRWGGSTPVGTARGFYEELARRLHEAGALRLSTLVVDGKPLSVMFNARLGAAEYNLMSAFNPAAPAGVSPTYLHFGYVLEAACQDGVSWFDFLAGQGRRRQYKRDFVTTERPLVTLQVVRARPLKSLYLLHRWLRLGTPTTA